MPIVTQNLHDIARLDAKAPVTFFVGELRESGTGDGTIIVGRRRSYPPVNGVITTDNLDPGDATVILDGQPFQITLPDVEGPIELWPLIDAQLHPTPIDIDSLFVRNAGGVRRIKVVTQTQFNAITMPDPETIYAFVEEN